MEAPGRGARDLLMTLAAGLPGVREGGVLHHSFVGSPPVGVLGVAAVADLTAYLTMVGVQEIRAHVDLFVRLQRSQRPSSALPRGLLGLGALGCQLFDLPADLDELARVGVAGHALALVLVRARERGPTDPDGNKDRGANGKGNET